MLRSVAILSVLSALTLESPAASADPVAAEALFREARALLEAGNVDAACEKFEASSAVEASSGTLLNLAACRLRQGRTATAWAYFAAAARSARAQNRPAHEKEAEQRAAELEPNLSYLTIQVSGGEQNIEILRNGREVEKASLGSKLPVDPGPLVIEASAPGYESVKVELTLGQAHDERVVTIPKLQRRVSEQKPATVSGSVPLRTTDKDSNPLPWVVGGVGAAALVTGGVFGVLALSSDAEAKRECHQKTTYCPQDALEAESRRDTQAAISTVGVGVGVVGVGIAAVLLLTAPNRESQNASALETAADFGPGHAFFRIRSRF